MSSSSSSSASDSDHDSAAPSHASKRVTKAHDVDDTDSDDSDSESSSDSQSDVDPEEDDAPVLSHAEQRRQKRKEQKAAKVAADATDANRKGKGKEQVKNTADLPPSKLPKRQNSIWVGNLSYETTVASLRSFFEGVGEITRIHMPTKMVAAGGPGGKGPRKENRGFAYVDFATPDAKVVAITLSENLLDGRRLLIKDGDDYNGRPTPAVTSGTETLTASKAPGRTKTAQKILSAQKQPPGPTLFLGNLGFETTADAIRELFESHRRKEQQQDASFSEPAAAAAADKTDKWIRKIRMGTFEDSGKCKGWAFVDFTTSEHATTALTDPRNHALNGRKLVVEYASPEAVRRGGGGPPRTDKTREKRGHDQPKARRKQDHNPAQAREDEDADRGGDGGGEEDGPPAKRRRAGDEKPAGGRSSSSSTRGRGGLAGRDGGDKWGGGGGGTRARARPGAALALAKREDVSIVPSQGKKIVF